MVVLLLLLRQRGRGNGRGGRRGVLAVVVVLAAHLGVLGDALLARLAADDGAAHGAGQHAADDDQDGGGQHDPAAPAHVGDEEQDVDEEGEQRDQEGGQHEDD